MKFEQLKLLEKANKFISRFSRDHEIQRKCADRAEQISTLKREVKNKRWNGITRTEQLDRRINSLAAGLSQDLPSENELRNSFKTKRGFVHEVIQASRVKGLIGLQQQLGTLERTTRIAAHKVPTR